MPGEKGFKLAEAQRKEGIALHPGIMESLVPWAEKLKVNLPAAS